MNGLSKLCRLLCRRLLLLTNGNKGEGERRGKRKGVENRKRERDRERESRREGRDESNDRDPGKAGSEGQKRSNQRKSACEAVGKPRKEGGKSIRPCQEVYENEQRPEKRG